VSTFLVQVGVQAAINRVKPALVGPLGRLFKAQPLQSGILCDELQPGRLAGVPECIHTVGVGLNEEGTQVGRQRLKWEREFAGH
jgi:hypothetical protein